MADLVIDDVVKSFGDKEVLKGISLDIPTGKFISLLGPSGCGKTTLLRCIAGLETVDSGRIIVGGDDVTRKPPEDRRLSLMFQSYALFPHMTVRDNVRFPLRMMGKAGGTGRQQRDRAEEALEKVRLGDLGSRMPRQLSGGQQQRVALARAIVSNPRVLLLDEPLSNLDARLREDMQIELTEIQRQIGITTVLVTHDQHEALSMSDTVVLMREGSIEQVGTPEDLYAAPESPYVAEFIGASNLLEVDVVESADGVHGVLPSGDRIPVADGTRPGRTMLVLRQERFTVGEPVGSAQLPVEVRARVFRGGDLQLVVAHEDAEYKVVVPFGSQLRLGDTTHISWSPADVVAIPVSG